MSTDLLIINGPGVVARRGEAVLWAEGTDLRREGLLAEIVQHLDEISAYRITAGEFTDWLIDELTGPRGSTVPALALVVPDGGEVLAVVHGWGRVTAPGGALTAPDVAHHIPEALPIAVGRADLAVLATGDSFLDLRSGAVPGGAGLLSPRPASSSSARHSAGPVAEDEPFEPPTFEPPIFEEPVFEEPAFEPAAASPAETFETPAPVVAVASPAAAVPVAKTFESPRFEPPAFEPPAATVAPDADAWPERPEPRPEPLVETPVSFGETAGPPRESDLPFAKTAALLPLRRPGASAPPSRGQAPGTPAERPPVTSQSLFGSRPIATPPPARAVPAPPPSLGLFSGMSSPGGTPVSPSPSPAPPVMTAPPVTPAPQTMAAQTMAPQRLAPEPPITLAPVSRPPAPDVLRPAAPSPLPEPLPAPVAPPAPAGGSSSPANSLVVSLQPDPATAPSPHEPLPIVRDDALAPSKTGSATGSPGGGADPRVAMVSGVECHRKHFNNPRDRFCRVCGTPLHQQTPAVQVQGERPSLGVLVCDDGTAYGLDGDYAIGADPRDEPGVVSGLADPLYLGDGEAGVASTHVIIHLDAWEILVLNRSPGLPAAVLHRGDSQWTPLAPGQWARLAPGSYVGFAGRHVVFESYATP
ncbi:MAG: hypothetical protein QG622_2425 [Actinomycetota bacterium]|nr:hypothetical protein [Actinomycetota bacterium]